MPFWKKEKSNKSSNKLERKGLFLYSEKLKEGMDEEELPEQLCELMEMYQTYHDIALTKQYVLRGSKMTCWYGTKPVLLDTQEDHGVYMGKIPVMACSDCSRRNIHTFGSCMCPEVVYEKRLPMTPPVHRNGEPAILAPGNHYPHICIPLVSKNGWQQEEDGVLIEDFGQVSPVLIDSATLVCQYGGIILIEEVPEKQEDEDKFIKDLREKGFTECYIKHLVVLHDKYPQWEFEAVITGVDYQQFVQHQIDNKLKCAEIRKYQTNEKFEGEKSDRYYIANDESIIFFSHPYSMLQTNQGAYENALQFLKADQKIDKEYSDKAVESILRDRDSSLIEKVQNSECLINSVFMACVIAAENGPMGEEYNGKPVYNIFNFGATDGRESGKRYAYNKGWFSLDACLADCDTEFKPFLDRKQNTLYALDWDYYSFGNGKDVRQYATLVNDAENKAIMMSNRNKEMFDLDQKFVFSIPVYDNIFTYNNEPCEPFPDPNKI